MDILHGNDRVYNLSEYTHLSLSKTSWSEYCVNIGFNAYEYMLLSRDLEVRGIFLPLLVCTKVRG